MATPSGTSIGTLMNVIKLEIQQSKEQPLAFVWGEIGVILLCVISSFPCLAVALGAGSLWPVKTVMCLKFKPVGDSGGCCLVSVLLMGERRRGKGPKTPGERERIRKGRKMKNIM